MSGHDGDADARRAAAQRLNFGLETGSQVRAVPNEAVPFRMLVVGAFGGQVADGMQGLSIRGEVPADLPGQLGVVARFTVPNLLGSAPDPIPVELPLRRLSDVSAKAVAAAVEPLRRAASLRGAVAGGLRSFEHYADLDRLVAAIGPATAPRRTAPATAPTDVDRLLSMLDVAGPAASEPPQALPPGAGPKGAAAAIDDLVARQLALVRAHPTLAAIEAAWRGLRLLTGAGLPPSAEIDLVDVAPGQAAATLISAVVPDELEGTGRARLACVLVAGAVPPDEAGLNTLALCAAAGAALQVPVIVSLTDGFFATSDPLIEAGWQMLRGDASAAWLACCLGDVVLGADGRDAPLWGEPGWAVTALALASFRQYGWPHELANPSAMTLDGMEVHEVAGSGGAAAWPLRRPPSRSEGTRLGALGVLSLAAQANRDRVFLAAAPCLGAGADLAGQMVAARLLAVLRASGPVGGASGVEHALRSALAGVGRVTTVRRNASDGFDVAVQIGPRTVAFSTDA